MPEIRDDMEALRLEVERLRSTDVGWQSGAFLAQITSGTESFTDPNVFYEVSPVTITGPDVEGEAATFTVNAATTLYAYNIGNSIPPIATLVVVDSVSSRYVFNYSI